jgi:hypothetical protein
VTLTTQTTPWFCWIANIGAGTATLTPQTGTINGVASLPVLSNFTTVVAFDGVNWWAGTSPIVPANTPGVAHEWIASYSSTTGVFTLTQPAFTDISGTATAGQVPALSALTGRITTSQLPSAGLTATIVTAQLTTLGTQGSQTFTNGILTAQVPAT